MITDDYSPREILSHIDPSRCSYQEWITVGMALKKAGESCKLWDQWSAADRGRYHPGECQQKWETFNGAAMRDVSIGTVISMAMRNWKPEQKKKDVEVYSWDSVIDLVDPDAYDDDYQPVYDDHDDQYKVLDYNWIQGEEVPPCNPNIGPDQQICQYIEALFEPDEYVCIVTDCYEHHNPDGTVKYSPMRGMLHKAQEWIDRINECHGEMWRVIGDTNPEWGAWVRFNPLDGEDVTDKNVTAYRYALVECDSIPLNKQYALIKELKLPVKVLVHSGNKSLHAIVKINAKSFMEYRERVEFLYRICDKNGLKVDWSARNPSRLSRLPGVMRNGNPQYIVAMEMGYDTWDDWKDYIDSINDELPDIESYDDYVNNLPPMAPELIHGILRKGHKMLLTGPSKAGKTFALLQLAIAIKEGREWMGFKCEQGKVLFLNLEVDSASCINRINSIHQAMGITPTKGMLDIWNLRGQAEPLDKLTPKIIRHCKENNYAAIIIDPIYKVLTGDENAAAEMALFCNQFDKLADTLKCSVIYCHHHPKGSQMGKKAADRASGSGVFARDPDAMVDLMEVSVNDDKMEEERSKARLQIARDGMKYMWPDTWMQDFTGVDTNNATEIIHRMGELDKARQAFCVDRIHEREAAIDQGTLFKVEGTLREFATFKPFYVWFRFPVHEMADGVDSAAVKGPAWGTEEARTLGRDALKRKKEEEKEENMKNFIAALAITGGGVKEMVEFYSTECSKRALFARAKRYGYIDYDGKFVNIQESLNSIMNSDDGNTGKNDNHTS